MCSSHISYVLPCLSVLPHKPYPGPFPLLVPIEGYVACPSPLAALYQELCRYHSPLGVLWQWRPPQDAAPPPGAPPPKSPAWLLKPLDLRAGRLYAEWRHTAGGGSILTP